MNWFTSLFNKAVRAFKQFLKLAFPIALQIFIGLLKDFAIEVVGKLESTDLSNADKRNQAFKEIELEARRRGLKFTASAVYTLIELALQYIKTKDA